MLNKEYTILEPFSKLWKKLTFKQVKELSKNKSDNYVHTILKKLVKESILKEEKVGNVIVYFLNNNVFSLNTLGFISEYKAKEAAHIPHNNLLELSKKIKTSFYSMIITGSYAKGKQKKISDVDLVIICDDKQKPAAILAQIKQASELMIPEIHPYVFTQVQFYEMLTNKEENYGKEIARNNLIITGGKEFYSIVLEAIENGFNG